MTGVKLSLTERRENSVSWRREIKETENVSNTI
jgi:hypothetical protein